MPKLIDSTFLGAATWWSLAPTFDYGRVLRAFECALLADQAPNKRTPVAALKSALDTLYKERRVLVRPCADRDSYAVVREGASGKAVDHQQVVTAWIDFGEKTEDGQAPAYLRVEPGDHDADVRLQWLRSQELLTGIEVSRALAEAAVKLGGTLLREAGGVYYLPEHAIDTWTVLSGALEGACIRPPPPYDHHGSEHPAPHKACPGSCTCTCDKCVRASAPPTNAVYLMRVPRDVQSLRAVVDAFTAEVRAQVQTIETDMAAGTLGARALRTREGHALDVLAKIARYEEELGVRLDELRKTTEGVQAAAAAAALTAMLADENEAAAGSKP